MTPAAPAAPAGDAAIRVVDAEAPVQSRKRGVSANKLEEADFRALAPGVSWWYNWYFEPKQTPPADVSFEFVPMVWGDRPAELAGLDAYLAAGNKPRQVLSINEPNLKGQAFITPEQTAELYKKIKAIAEKHGVQASGPQMALGSATGDSITAYDPIEHKEVTYTYTVPFVNAFLHYAGDTAVPNIGYHAYGDIHELRWSVGEMHKQFDRPLWVTEYAWWNAPTVAEARKYLIQSTDLLERSPHVEAYAWFKERADHDKISLLGATPGQLTALGEAYVNMPVHDADLYYRTDGRLQAERYVSMKGAEIFPTTDSDGFTDMSTGEAGAWLDFNVHADQAGAYELVLRVSGIAGDIQVLRGDEVLVTLKPEQRGWHDVSAQVQLAAGPQTIRLRFASSGQTINWVEFNATPAPEPAGIGVLGAGVAGLVVRRRPMSHPVRR